MKNLAPAAFVLSLALLPAAARGQAPALVPAALRGIAPAGVTRGRTVRLTLDGVNVRDAARAVFDDPAIGGAVSPGANRNQANVTATIGAETRVGIHRVYLHTPLGTTGSVTFAVGAWPEVPEREPNDSTVGDLVTLPATLTGTLDRPGDPDHFRFRAAAGAELVFEVVASQIRSRLQSVLSLLDERGQVLAEGQGEGRADAVLAYRFAQAGTYALRVRDLENASGGDVTYRVNAGPFPFATHVFPLGVPKDGGEIALAGMNLKGDQKLRVSSEQSGWGAAVTVSETPIGTLLNPVRIAVGNEPEVRESEMPGEGTAGSQPVEVPVTINGRIAGPGKPDADFYRFRARKGRSLILEVQARRLGSPLDSVIEVLDREGGRIERATLRCVAETAMTLSDRDSASAGIRLLSWSDFQVNDFVYIRGEVIQLVSLPRGPDDDARFRTLKGQRAGLLETTPGGHAVNTPVYKVQVHPPGRTFPPNGMPVFRLYYRNDDGGPLYGKDSRLTFTAPADGEYVVRISDVRGEGSDRHAYRLTIREPRPDFRLALSPEHPNVPAGASVPLEVTADRLDGFDGEIEVGLEGLPEGISATGATIEAGEMSATLLLTAAVGAKTYVPEGKSTIRLVGRAKAGAGELVRTVEPADGRCLLTVLPKPDLDVKTTQRKITIVPGTEQGIDAEIVRQNGFGGRVPIDLKNLPFGVRVLDVGLNGVLITENETARRFTIICEPWVRPLQRLVYCTVRTETESPASTEIAAEPILLEVAPKPAARRANR
jgi:hypothetical protein